jgi:hypothetical protein
MFWLGLALILVAEAVALALFSRIAPYTLVFLLTPIVPLTLVVAFIVYSKLDELSYKARRLSPEVIASHSNRRPATDSPEELSRSIVEALQTSQGPQKGDRRARWGQGGPAAGRPARHPPGASVATSISASQHFSLLSLLRLAIQRLRSVFSLFRVAAQTNPTLSPLTAYLTS